MCDGPKIEKVLNLSSEVRDKTSGQVRPKRCVDALTHDNAPPDVIFTRSVLLLYLAGDGGWWVRTNRALNQG